uniref:Uncharacterized protein n=1 Tax=Anguilla anguilla TaxID=7936 RepID=A0A0E9UBE3_ANGAN
MRLGCCKTISKNIMNNVHCNTRCGT